LFNDEPNYHVTLSEQQQVASVCRIIK